ncbi:MAG: hypothetical protein ACYDHY_14090 [Acidiferrobacterales bacterium]
MEPKPQRVLTVYLDTSFIVPPAIAEASSGSVEAFFLGRKTGLATSQSGRWAAV